ncbi:MAG: methyltransferase domain-containing protein [Verrucomicrobia bacterium]|nr:MAG: methyltransferase domain-containing protein [Verrucomicrobiota bacterium]
MPPLKNIVPTAYVNRAEFFLERCRGRRVLHLGCVGFTDASVEDKVRLARESLHAKLSAVCDCTGVDLDAVTVEQLRAAGIFQNVLIGDVERLDDCAGKLPLFDLVVAGDIIEHLSNPGLMLDGVRRVLKPGGSLLVSTPNALSLPSFLRHVRGTFREGNQHALSFNAITLAQLLERHGYTVAQALTCHHALAPRLNPLTFRTGVTFFRAFPKFGGTLLFEARA